MNQSYSVGIDLGTSNSVIAYPNGGGLDVLTNERGDRKTPSVVASSDGEMIVGKPAVNQAVKQPEKTIYSIKRRMGEPEYQVELDGRTYRPEEISAIILKKLVADAETELGASITDAVITVPAYFNHRQREATIRAGELAGLNVKRLLNEPTAACLAHGLGEENEKLVFVYDLGGGTFDVSLVRIDDGLFEVLATDGQTELGGEDWDSKIVSGLVSHVQEETGTDVKGNPQTMQRIWDAAQEAKHDLSSRDRTTISIPFLLSGDESYNLEKSLTRDQFESMTEPLLENTIDICETLLQESDVRRRDIDDIILVGGATRMPMVRDRLTSLFGMTPKLGINPDEAVGMGAAAQAGIMQDSLPVPADADPAPADPRAETDIVSAPTDQNNAEPMKALDDVVLLDVTSKTLGIKAHKNGEPGYFFPHIEKDSSVPASATDTYHTLHDNQTEIVVPVYQGESERAEENELLDEFSVSGIPPAPAGEMSVEVTFQLDRDGVLTVTAENPDSGSRNDLTIESGIDFTEEEMTELRSNLPEVR
ncbi:Hsp70 family protein [Halosimplex halobium]|uniref:Hsp70 family protein n=1 Tax=Halosimplex halobium TaxID=3396618 RepID=UPI003F54EB4C